MRQARPDRRIHRVFVTRNREYHLRRDVCVAVRDLATGCWMHGHDAIHRRVVGSLYVAPGGATIRRTMPRPGEALVFADGLMVTSPVVRVDRPARAIVDLYARLLPDPDAWPTAEHVRSAS